MYRSLLLLFCLLSLQSWGQTDDKWLRAFPITNYIVDLSDSVKIVQVKLPPGTVIAEKQAGWLKAIYRTKISDTASIGFGRCNLIKGEYYYFTIKYKKNGRLPQEGDLLFTMMDRKPIYFENVAGLAANFIELQDTYGKPFYDRYEVFSDWDEHDELILMDTLLNDIHFVATYFLETNPDMNVKINAGSHKDKMVLNVMQTCRPQDVTDFLDYMIARPHLYAGNQWKMAEIFATWLAGGSPTVLKN